MRLNAAANERQINASDLIIGMYVSNLDRPWVESPFEFQGFMIKNQEELRLIKENCQFVFVDPDQGVCPTDIDACRFHHKPAAPKLELTLEEITGPASFEPDAPTPAEASFAERAYAEMEALYATIAQQIHAGEQLDINRVLNSLGNTVEGVRNNFDAFMQLIMLNGRPSDRTTDVITTTVLATALSSHVGIKDEQLAYVAAGAFLYDMGKLRLPQELLDKPKQFSPAEFNVVKTHVQEGVELVSNAKGAHSIITAMAQHHHERYDGSGYPSGLKGDKIPTAARIAAIVDCFNAITAHRAHSPAMSPYHAALKLYEWRNVDFDPRLVEQFIQTIGVYPIGTFVELTNGEIAVVVAHNKNHRLQPIVAIVHNPMRQRTYSESRVVNLANSVKQNDGSMLGIKKAVIAQRFGLDIVELDLLSKI